MYSTNLPQGLIFSSSLQELKLTFQLPSYSDVVNYADVSVTSDHGPVIYSSRLFFKGNAVSVYNFRNLVEDNLSALEESYDRLEINVSVNGAIQAPLYADIIFCRSVPVFKDAACFLRTNFLSYASQTRIPASGFSFSLAWYALKYESLSYRISAVYRDENGSQGILAFDTEQPAATSDGIHYISIGAATVRALVAGRMAGHQFELLAFSVYVGDRTAAFFIDGNLSGDSAYMFRNDFNISEIVFIQGATKRKSNLESSTAIVSGQRIRYDLKQSRIFAVESGPLDQAEAERAELFMLSDRKYKAIGFADGSVVWKEIFVDEIKFEVDQHPTEPQSVSFTWEPIDSRPMSVFSDSIDMGIFAQQFNPVFN